MTSTLEWLPRLILLEEHGGDWDAYLSAVYDAFLRDFGEGRPEFLGKRMGLKKHPEYEGKSATFWHMISSGSVEAERTPDLRRCERISWPMAMLRAVDRPDLVVAWKEAGPHRGDRVLVALLDFSYLVVMNDREEYCLPWTAYPVEREHQRRKLERRRKQGQEC